MKKQILATSFAILLLSVGITVNADDSVVKVSAIQGESNFSTNIPETPVSVNFSDITNTSSLINGSFTFTASLLNKEFTLWMLQSMILQTKMGIQFKLLLQMPQLMFHP